MKKPIEEAAIIYNSRTQDFGLLSKAFLYSATIEEILEFMSNLKTIDKFSFLLRDHLITKSKNGDFKKIGVKISKMFIWKAKSDDSALRGYFSKLLLEIFPILSSQYQNTLFSHWVMSERPIDRIRGYNSFIWVKSNNTSESLIYESYRKYGDRRAFIQLMMNGTPSKLNSIFKLK